MPCPGSYPIALLAQKRHRLSLHRLLWDTVSPRLIVQSQARLQTGLLCTSSDVRLPKTTSAEDLDIIVSWHSSHGIQAALQIPSVIESSSGVWLITQSIQPTALKKAFEIGEANPTDVSEDGGTLLHVS